MSDLKKALKEEYDKKSAIINVKSLMEMIEEVMDAMPLLERAMPKTDASTDKKEGEYFLPTIKITEAWGQPGTKDRELIEQFTARIGGNTLEEKIKNINRVIVEADQDAGIPQVLSSMVMIEILNAILAEFTESAGGFIFEGFLAGLFGDDAVQITDVGEQEQETGATGKPITDVVLGGQEYSLKLLGQTTGVKGSFRNMIEHFKGRDHIIYLDARRTGEGLEFGEFKITLDNFDEVFIDPFLKQVTAKKENISKADDLKNTLDQLKQEGKPLKSIKFAKNFPGTRTKLFSYSPKLDEVQVSGQQLNQIMRSVQSMSDEELQDLGPYTISYADTKFEGTKAEKLFGSFGKAQQVRRLAKEGNKDQLIAALEDTPGYKGRQQFEFTRGQAENIVGFKEIGELKISPDALKETWLAYGDVLKANVEPIYKALNKFSNDINLFFLSGDDKDGSRKQYGVAAANGAKELQTSTDKAVKEYQKTP